MFIHPEIRQDFLYEKSKMAHNKPGLTYDNVCEAVRTKLWIENMESTAVMLKALEFCPYEYSPPVEEYERELQMQDVMDEATEQFDEEEGF